MKKVSKKENFTKRVESREKLSNNPKKKKVTERRTWKLCEKKQLIVLYLDKSSESILLLSLKNKLLFFPKTFGTRAIYQK